jgi:hypothetical protein
MNGLKRVNIIKKTKSKQTYLITNEDDHTSGPGPGLGARFGGGGGWGKCRRWRNGKWRLRNTKTNCCEVDRELRLVKNNALDGFIKWMGN